MQRARGANAQRRNDNAVNSIDFSKPILVPSSSTNFAYSRGSNNNIIKNVPYNNVFPDTNDIFLTKQKNAVGNTYSSYTNYNGDRGSRGRSLDMEIVDMKQEWDQAQNNRNNPSSPNYAHRSGQVYEQAGNFRSSHSQPIEGSFYEWRKIVSDCSVVCGTGKFSNHFEMRKGLYVLSSL